jgi:hypothetical protein
MTVLSGYILISQWAQTCRLLKTNERIIRGHAGLYLPREDGHVSRIAVSEKEIIQTFIFITNHVRNEEVLLRVKEQRNILHEIRKRKANWIGHIFFNISYPDVYLE